MTGEQFAAAARAYLRVPFAHLGRSRAGLDCAGLLLAAARDCGVPGLPEPVYGRLPDLRLIDTWLPRFAVRVAVPRVGDVLRFRLGGRAQHLGVACAHPAGGLAVVHACESLHRVCEHRFDLRWQRRLAEAWRLHGAA